MLAATQGQSIKAIEPVAAVVTALKCLADN